ncbi:MAG: low molecular weight phosphotyrosine protein phosphatase [Betaproteobacteria bacterium]|nr:low molecular weight phosphotyrosine protein phosphatase [Betaproteobacteria bacterium]
MASKIRILFVCMGNICRSPTAEGVFRHLVSTSPLAGRLEIDSAGTVGYHAGSPPDPRALVHASKRGYDLSALRSRQVRPSDFESFDYVLAMDNTNVRTLKSMCPSRLTHKIELLLDYGLVGGADEVPDPYDGQAEDFEIALDLIEEGCKGLLDYLMEQAQV